MAEGWIQAPRRTGLQPLVLYRSDMTIAGMLDEDRGD